MLAAWANALAMLPTLALPLPSPEMRDCISAMIFTARDLVSTTSPSLYWPSAGGAGQGGWLGSRRAGGTAECKLHGAGSAVVPGTCLAQTQ